MAKIKANKKKLRNQSIVKFSNDLFFKYAISKKLKASVELRKKIPKLVSNLDFEILEVRNSEINQDCVKAKNIVLDINAINEYGETIDIEMQMSNLDTTEVKRFQFYGARMVVEQLNQGEEYHLLKRVYQYIFINDTNKELVETYISKNQNNETEEDFLNVRNYIHMKNINKILKDKDVSELTDLERLCYLFVRNDYADIIKDDKDDIIRQVVSMYQKFASDGKMWEMGVARQLALVREASFKSEYREKGRKEGLAEGLIKGKNEGLAEGEANGKRKELIASSVRIVKNIYHFECKKWLEVLTDKQLERLQDLAFSIKDFSELKQRINEVK